MSEGKKPFGIARAGKNQEERREIFLWGGFYQKYLLKTQGINKPASL
ncbi:hypothetical protein AVDCRST_MAG84-1033 [uncultured Microcoleus sp.]|uniref:Uncharacterized protein n=1 Tax=uncultured Microcoleus sp. TaxID=259945 RepID=A0A6J4KUC6_9CYAN|nr:hypothetical protein AVDCRST_MAG84-1033 [uncultured Microcoleus sp.]